VVSAYESLISSGYLLARQGAGTVVAGIPDLEEHEIDFTPHWAWDPPDARWVLLAGFPDLGAFPRGDWLNATMTVLRRMPQSAWGYTDARGASELRVALATRLARTRGIMPSPERIVVTNGSTQAHLLAFKVLKERGAARIAVEDPGWPMQKVVAEDAGLEPVPIPVDEQGVRVDVLAEAGVGAAVVTPAHHFPLGVTLAPERRAALLGWAGHSGGVIVEDDYDAEFRYDGFPTPALQVAAPEHVISVGSFSKSLAPGLRLGWLVLPSELAVQAARIKERLDNGSSILGQLVVAELEASGRMDRHLRRMARRYERRRKTLVRALDRELPEIRLLGIAAGLHAAAELPATLDEGAVVEAARSRKIAINGISYARIKTPPDPPMLELGYGNLPETSIREAVSALAEAVASTAG
jgi:GntR family transcriptional regulator/MocR family aminotransferase